MTPFEATLVRETVARLCPDTGDAYPDLGPARAVDVFGTEAVNGRSLPPIANAGERLAIAISEPVAGSNVPAMETTVEERDGDLIVIATSKHLVAKAEPDDG